MSNLASRFSALATLTAIGKSFAVIEFDPMGNIQTASESFCKAVGYSLAEILGKPHSLFVDPTYAKSSQYRAFWDGLKQGSFQSGEFKRFGKGGREIWLQASYTPVLGRRGRVVKVVKLALDVTDAKIKSTKDAGILAAVSRAQGVIEFNLDGVIIDVNDNFLAVVGYERDEVIGHHHSMFVDDAYGASVEYQTFWQKLRRGEYFAEEFPRIAKGGRIVWLQASYNPIFDPDGSVSSVIKFATDVTERVALITVIGGALTQLAGGDLEHRIHQTLSPALESLRGDFNTAMDRLHQAMKDITSNTNAIRGGGEEISHAANDLSRRTEQQAASLEETAAALDEITATVRRTADGAREAAAVVAEAQVDAHHSGEVVLQAVDAMGVIENSSNQVSQIIGVIDEIAFQTNLLALNAGVEAARAGDAGRGFAVVAAEVRALAQRSADAAKDIKALISASNQQVKNGVSLVGETGKALERIVIQVGRINMLVTEIALSAQEQSASLAQVNTAVNQMDQMTQQNATMAQQSTAASYALAREADSLADLVAQFKVGTPSASSSHRSPQPSAPTGANPSRPALRSRGHGGAVQKLRMT